MRNWSLSPISVAWLLLALLASACGQTASSDTQGGVDVQFQIDIQSGLDALAKDGGLGDLPDDALDATDAVPGDDEFENGGGNDGDAVGGGKCEFPSNPQDGEAGAKCKVDGDCNSGLCVNAPKGKVCSYTCYECCPTGFACKPYGGQNGSLVCQAVGLEICRPCVKDAECAKDGPGALCVHYGDSGSFCGSACADAGDCSAGYTCQEAKGEKGSAKQCVSVTGECSCSDDDVAEGASTVCQVTNSFGSCTGNRVCGASGLSACPAATPAQEVCGDGVDNDCNGQTDEANAAGCTAYFVDKDADGDGKAGGASKCLCAPVDTFAAVTATDCDDKNAAVNGQALETCDGQDNNCDGKTDEGCDTDGDGFCNAEKALVGSPAICPKGSGDCDDADAGVHPDQQETCGNFKDDDCDGLTDSGANVTACVPFFEDDDGDGYGVGVPVCQCGVKPGYTATKGGDCNDDDDGVHPNATEICNGFDDNCDGNVDEIGASGCSTFFADADGDGYGVGASLCLCAADKLHSAAKGGDCDDAAVGISPGATETCNGKDDDCDGEVDEMGAQGCTTYYLDGDGDGFGDPSTGTCLCAANPLAPTTNGNDCDDSSAAAHPGAAETCDGIDNNCDGITDGANTPDCTNFYVDGDGDGYGNGAKSVCQCASDATYATALAGDCQDDNASVNPGVTEVCDGVDNNCVSGVDEEDATGCTDWSRDHDGDGYGAVKDTKCLCAKVGEYTSAFATDCNDNDKTIHPKALEICDGLDNDCDGEVDPIGADGCNNWFVDKDGDGYGTYAQPSKCLCDGGIGFASMGGDCNDGDSAINPDATEVCNGKDDNCDLAVDPLNAGGCTVYYSDADNDGYGVSNLSQCTCAPQNSFTATQGGDCKDADPNVNPGHSEACNGQDDNCNGQTDEGLTKSWFVDSDKDGYGTGIAKFGCAATGAYTATQSGDCDDNAATTYPGAPEQCNGVDDNCNGQTDEGGSSTKYFLDNDGDGYGTGGGLILCGTSAGYTATSGGDCDDSNAAIHPGVAEICNGKDDDCNGLTDDGLATGQYYKDADNDGYGTGAAITACSGVGFVALNGDCNDASAAIHPNAAEICDGLDNDCNGQADDGLPTSTYFTDADKDGYGVGAGVALCGPLGANTAFVGGDCDDSKAGVNPGVAAEVCATAYDDNCNGQVNEGCVVAVCADHVIDDFESGGVAGWTYGSGWNVAGWAALAGGKGLGFGNGSSYPSQADATLEVTVPALATSLEFDYHQNSGDIFCSFDHFQLYVNGTRYLNVGPCSNGWDTTIHYTLNAIPSSLAGTTMTIMFRVASDSSDNSGYYTVDNLKFGCK